MTTDTPSAVRHVACPTCGGAVPWLPQSRYRPFCSERCKLIDLGAWAAERYRMAGRDGPAPDEDDSR